MVVCFSEFKINSAMRCVMITVRRVVGTILLVPLLALSQTNSTGASKPGASTGTAIGNAVSAAISVAFPGISSIINAIWPKNDNSKKTKDNATASTTVSYTHLTLPTNREV